MAESVLGRLQQNLAKMAAPAPVEGVLGEQRAVESFAAAASGKAISPGEGPARSTQAEKSLATEVNRGLQNLSQDMRMEQVGFAQQQKAQEDKAELDNKILSEQYVNMQESMLAKQQEILTSFVRSDRELDLNKDKAKAEQFGFNLRLSNKLYVQNLQQEAAKARLVDSTNFQEELMRSVFAEEQDLFADSLEFRRLMAADEREFNELVANIDINFALQVAAAQNEEANQRMMWEGISGVVQGGASAWVKYEKDK